MAAASYHHGNLRQALLEHAVELARAGGPDAVMLRDVQRAAGVSNSAAYRHYADRQALLTAVQIHGMRMLGEAMTEALAALPPRGPRIERALARFRATGQAYVDFALAEPGLFRTAFAPGGVHHTDESVAPERHPFQILSGCIDDLVAAGVLNPSRRDGLDEAAWAAVHGLAVLYLDGPLAAADADRKQLITDRLLDLMQTASASRHSMLTASTSTAMLADVTAVNMRMPMTIDAPNRPTRTPRSVSPADPYPRRGTGRRAGDQCRDDDRQCRSADSEFGVGRLHPRTAVDRGRLQPGVRRAGAGRRNDR